MRTFIVIRACLVAWFGDVGVHVVLGASVLVADVEEACEFAEAGCWVVVEVTVLVGVVRMFILHSLDMT